jgi:hypothetical protein
MSGRTQFRILVRHFVRRFIDNDLISAHSDRHETLAFFGAALIAAGMFASVLIGTKYLFGVPSPGWVAVSAMYDLATIVSVCMIVVALTTIAQWDALSLDARDAAVLGPLPIEYRTIVRAKVAANALFGLAVVAAAAVPCSLIFSFFELASLQLATSTEVRVVLSQVVATTLAGLYAFIAVIALREGLRLLTGSRGFARVSPLVQACLVIALTTMLLLVLGGNETLMRMLRASEDDGPLGLYLLPPSWFVGLAQAMNGDGIALAPVGGVVLDDNSSRFYVARRDVFVQLGVFGVAATLVTLLLSGFASFWNSRRLPSAIPQGTAHWRRLSACAAWCATRTIVQRPVAQATFFFTLRVLFRNKPHRLALAVGAAVALSLAIALVGAVGLERSPSESQAPLSLWALQPLALITLAAALRHATALPAELRANWIFHQCWSGQLHQSVIGARRGALVAVLAPAVLILFPIHVFGLGMEASLFHAMNGLMLSVILITLATIDRTAPPFLTSYVRTGNVSTIGPILILIAVTCSLAIATLERAASEDLPGMVGHTLVMSVLAVTVAVAARGRLSVVAPLVTDLPEPSPDPLRLSG